MDQRRQNQLDGAAALIALQELLRLVISEMCYDPDPEKCRQRISRVEEAAVNGITGRRHFPQASEEDEEYTKESASALVSKIMASIQP
ncbi:hypothetical protein [Shinella zoogloeoides]